MNIKSQMKAALEHYQSGNLHQAEINLREVLKVASKNITAINLLGIISYQLKNYASAIGYMKKLISLTPHNAQAHYIIGHSMQEQGQFDEAIPYYQKTLRLDTNFPGAYYNLGTIFQDKKRNDEAITCYRKALGIDPIDADAHYNLGRVLQEKGLLDEAMACYRRALEINPDLADAYNNIGCLFEKVGQFDEAVLYYQKALQINPNLADTYSNIGNILQKKGQLEEAITCHQQALRIDPNFAKAYASIGDVLKYRGQLDDAETFVRRAIQIQPHDLNFSQALLFTMLYNSRHDAKTIFSEHLQFATKFLKPLYSLIPHHTNECSQIRRLKIGYVSPDFRSHSVAYFIEPVLRAHSRKYFDVFCYSNNFMQDGVAKRIQEHTGQWRTIAGMSDENAAELILKDGIDILIDLAGNTANEGILLFARKPAPVQVSWIGYPATTGLSTIDYKLVDQYTDPPGLTEQFYTEKLMRMPESFLCYLPDKDSPEVCALPALQAGHVTFGSFNVFAKLSPEVFTSWIGILKAAPNTHLLIKSKSLSDTTLCNQVNDMFMKEGIDPERIELLSWLPTTRDHLDIYSKVDIALDTFPYNGTTTTCEAMWMGVPVITFAGKSLVSRTGVSLLTNVGLTELIAQTNEEYREIAIDLSCDIKRLQSLRKRLRDMMSQSPLCNAERFVMNLENCYRKMWETWCRSV